MTPTIHTATLQHAAKCARCRKRIAALNSRAQAKRQSANMTQAQRTARAIAAAEARWGKRSAESPDSPDSSGA